MAQTSNHASKPIWVLPTRKHYNFWCYCLNTFCGIFLVLNLWKAWNIHSQWYYHNKRISSSESFIRWLTPSLLLTPSCSPLLLHAPLAPSYSLRLRKLPRLPRVLRLAQGSQGFLRLQEGPRGPGGNGEWVSGGARSLSLTEDPRLPKASKGSQSFLRLQEGCRGPGRFRVQGRVRGAKGSEGVWGARWGRPLSLTEDPRLPKASEALQGFLRPQEGPRGSGRLKGWGEARGSKGWGEQGFWVWLKTQGCWRLPKVPKGMFWAAHYLWAKFWGGCHVSWAKGPFPDSQLAPPTPNRVSRGRA